MTTSVSRYCRARIAKMSQFDRKRRMVMDVLPRMHALSRVRPSSCPERSRSGAAALTTACTVPDAISPASVSTLVSTVFITTRKLTTYSPAISKKLYASRHMAAACELTERTTFC